MEPRTIELQKKRFTIEILEERIAPAHLGHEVVLPPAAAHGEGGINEALAAPGDHHKASLSLTLISH